MDPDMAVDGGAMIPRQATSAEPEGQTSAMG